MFIYSHAIFVTVTSKCCVKRVICKTWIVTLANSADLDQRLQNVASVEGLHCLLTGSLNETVLIVQDHFPSLHS